jgi:hypothetical protein
VIPLILVAGIIAFCLLVVVPIVAILTEHQRKMATIYQSKGPSGSADEIAQLRQEVRELKDVVYQALIATDSRPLGHQQSVQAEHERLRLTP